MKRQWSVVPVELGSRNKKKERSSGGGGSRDNRDTGYTATSSNRNNRSSTSRPLRYRIDITSYHTLNRSHSAWP